MGAMLPCSVMRIWNNEYRVLSIMLVHNRNQTVIYWLSSTNLVAGISSLPNLSLKVKVKERIWVGRVNHWFLVFSFFLFWKWGTLMIYMCQKPFPEYTQWVISAGFQRQFSVESPNVLGQATGIQIQVHMMWSYWARMKHSVVREHRKGRKYQSCTSQEARVPQRSMLGKVRDLSRQMLLTCISVSRSLAQGLAYRF